LKTSRSISNFLTSNLTGFDSFVELTLSESDFVSPDLSKSTGQTSFLPDSLGLTGQTPLLLDLSPPFAALFAASAALTIIQSPNQFS
jgi:hypothetical protein